MPADIFSRLHEVDEATVRMIADVLEVRGQHPQQVAIRADYLDTLGDIAGQGVLEVGCGTGPVTRDIARRVGASGSVAGTDPTPIFVEVAERLRADQRIENLTFRVADGRSLPFDDASFDGVAAVTVLSHVPHRETVLREMIRVAKPDGWLLIMDGDFAAYQIEHPDPETTQQIVDAWRATTVDEPRLMRRVMPFLEAAGLRSDHLRGHLHVEAGRVDEATSFVWQWSQFAVRQALAAGAIGETDAARWTEQLRASNEGGRLYGAIPFLSVIARRIEGPDVTRAR